MATSRVYVEEGKTSVFAVSLDWPGWCRRAKTADLALESLDDYRDRYAKIPSIPFRPGNLQVVATLKGNATTDFGAPDARGPFDAAALRPRNSRVRSRCSKTAGTTSITSLSTRPPLCDAGLEAEGAIATPSSITCARPSGPTARAPGTAWRRVHPGTNNATW